MRLFSLQPGNGRCKYGGPRRSSIFFLSTTKLNVASVSGSWKFQPPLKSKKRDKALKEGNPKRTKKDEKHGCPTDARTAYGPTVIIVLRSRSNKEKSTGSSANATASAPHQYRAQLTRWARPKRSPTPTPTRDAAPTPRAVVAAHAWRRTYAAWSPGHYSATRAARRELAPSPASSQRSAPQARDLALARLWASRFMAHAAVIHLGPRAPSRCGAPDMAYHEELRDGWSMALFQFSLILP